MIYLRYKAVEIGVSRALNVKGTPADVVNGLIIEKYRDVSVLKEGVG